MQKFQTPAPVAAVVDIPAGRVQVIAADRADTVVEVRPADAAKSRDLKAAERIEVEYGDGVLRIAAAPARHKLIGHSGEVEITVQVPAGSRVQAQVAAGELRGVGRLGEVAFAGQAGSVKLDQAAGAHLTLMAGDVQLGRLDGPARISTRQGDITVTEAAGGTVELSTQDGSVSIGAARGVSATLDAGTALGRIDNGLQNSAGAGAELVIKATTSRGDITARSL